jgi:hypothetical protein
MTLTDFAKSHCRVIVAAVVGFVISYALRHGADLSNYQGALTTVLTVAYYALVRILERYVTPKFGWLLGLAQQPVYAKVTTRKDTPVHNIPPKVTPPAKKTTRARKPDAGQR